MPISPRDLFLSPDLTEAEARLYLAAFGFNDPAAADEHLQALGDEPSVREALAQLAETLLDALRGVPDPDSALVGFCRYAATRSSRTMFLGYLYDDPRALGLLIDVLGTSPFLTEILIRNPEYFHWLVPQIDRAAPDALDLAEETEGLLARVDSTEGRLDTLKRLKRREILRIASRDILGRETVRSATTQISNVAEMVINNALQIAEEMVCTRAGVDRLPGRFAVIALGKLGGRELNYSSDIDLLYVYEPHDEKDAAAHALFQRLGRTLTSLVTDYTGEGYLYRLDLRLRPMGRRGNIAYSLEQCRQYYDGWGETFERFALIKSRVISGDQGLGDRFVELVQPFVYRKYLDHTAIEEIYRYKARAERAQADAARDVKIGRGGIREVEVFAQVLQLTYGARHPELRGPNTLDALSSLHAAGLVGEDVRATLADAYEFLRSVEHRLQIVHDQQTHALGADRELEISARRMGLADAAALEAELTRQRDRVHDIYQTIFARRPGSTDFLSRQFFRVLVEEASEEETRELLAASGITDTTVALEAIRALDQAAWSSSRSTSRNVLANLLAALSERLARCAGPERILIRLEQLTERTGASVSFFRSLLENDTLRDLLVATLDAGDLPANRLIKNSELLDSMMHPLPENEELRVQYRTTLARVEPPARRAAIRRLKAGEEFKMLVEWIGDESLGRLQERLTVLAESCVAQAADWHAPEGREDEWVIVALGKLGGRELTIHSDLDLVVIYRGSPHDSETFLRWQSFVENVVRELEQPTDDGFAYRVDTRLRPEGKKGSLAIPLEVFQRYFETRADLWERLAWTRGRVIAGSPLLGSEVQEAVEGFVYAAWDQKLPDYMRNLRARMERELGTPGGGALDFKVGRGGLVDIDFALQAIQVREGHERHEFRVAGTRQLLEVLPETDLLTSGETDGFRHAHQFLRNLEIQARLEADTHVTAVSASQARLEAVARRMRLDGTLVETYGRVTDQVRQTFETVLQRLSETPAR